MMGRLARSNDDGALASESFCDRAADAAPGSRDNCDLILQTIHGCLLLRSKNFPFSISQLKEKSGKTQLHLFNFRNHLEAIVTGSGGLLSLSVNFSSETEYSFFTGSCRRNDTEG